MELALDKLNTIKSFEFIQCSFKFEENIKINIKPLFSLVSGILSSKYSEKLEFVISKYLNLNKQFEQIYKQL